SANPVRMQPLPRRFVIMPSERESRRRVSQQDEALGGDAESAYKEGAPDAGESNEKSRTPAATRGKRMTRILIADDHAVVRAGLRQFLEEDRSIVEIGEARTGSETLDKLRTGTWDLVILDIFMPDRSGLDILKQIQASHPGTKILIISGLPERQYALNSIKAGASGYLAKDSAPEELLKAVDTVLRG